MFASCEGSRKFQESCVELEKQSSSKRIEAVVQPVVEDPVEDDRIPAEAGAGMIPEPSENDKNETRVDTQSPSNHVPQHASKG